MSFRGNFRLSFRRSRIGNYGYLVRVAYFNLFRVLSFLDRSRKHSYPLESTAMHDSIKSKIIGLRIDREGRGLRFLRISVVVSGPPEIGSLCDATSYPFSIAPF